MPLFIDQRPHMRMNLNKLTLPKGNPLKKGYLVFLMSDNVEESINMINNPTIIHNGYYRYYYYDYIYHGTMYGRFWHERRLNERNDIYAKVMSRTRQIYKHPMTDLDKNGGYNTYFDMSHHMNIWKRIIAARPGGVTNKLKRYIQYLRTILERPDTKGYTKYLLIDVKKHVFRSGGLSDLIDNPIFCLYYALYRYPDLVAGLDVNFVLYVDNASLTFNFATDPELAVKHDYLLFRREVSRLMRRVSRVTIEDLNEEQLKKEESESNVKEALNEKFHFLGDHEDLIDISEKPSKIEKGAPIESRAAKKPATKATVTKNSSDGTAPKVTKKIDKPQPIVTPVPSVAVQKKVSDTVGKLSQSFSDDFGDMDPDVADIIQDDIIMSTAEDELEEDPEVMAALYNAAVSNKVKTSAASSARDAELRKKQGEVNIKGMKLKDIEAINIADVKIPEIDVSSKLHTTNKNLATQKFTNFESVYNEQCLTKDISSAFTCLAEKEMPMYIVSTEVTDSSNELNYKETWRVVLEDSNRTRHTVSVDIPKFFEDKFLYLGGNKKTITKQNFFYPIVKTGPDTVQIVTNYNKVFIRRMGTKSFANVERLIKAVSKVPSIGSYFSMGSAFNINTGRMSTIEFDELSKTFYAYKHNGIEIFFSRDSGDERVPPDKVPEGYMMLGLKGGKPIFINLETQRTDDGESIMDIIEGSWSDEERAAYEATSVGKRLLFTSATIMAQTIPLVALIGYWEGLTTVLKKAGIQYTVSQKRVSPSINQAVVRFSDCYIVYENTISAQLIMNGINVFNTASYDFAEFDEQTPYIEYFRKVYGKAAVANALTNAYEFLIDPITLEILKDLKLPEDIVSLCIHASNLLADNDYTAEGKEWLYRVRSNEIIPAILYSVISRYYVDYRNSGGRHKLSIPRDAVIKEVLKLQTVEDYSVLNPVVEVYKTSEISCKGFRGANLDDAYNEEKRSFDPSMKGIMAMSTSPDGNCGINRELTWEPKINNARGYTEMCDNDKLNDVNLFSVSELVTSLGCTKDDPIRTAMAGKQTRHVVPTVDSAPVLISNGVEEAIKYKLGSDFIVTADDDGEVIEVNEKCQIMVVKYKNGKNRAIDISPHMVKNGGGGFYISNQLITDFKPGDKFKKYDTLAWHKDYFTKDPLNGVRMNMGTLAKVAVMSNYNTYQDGSIATVKLSESMRTAITLPDVAVIGRNSNIEYMAKIGDHVEVGDSLIQFDESFEENELNRLLGALSDEMAQGIMENSRNNIKASHPGVIRDIQIYATSELEEMSESARKVVEKYYKGIMDRKTLLEKYDKGNTSVVKCGMLFTSTTGKIEPNAFGVIKGHKVDDGGIIIEFYIEHGDKVKVGDKGVLFTANKVVFDEVIPPGYEPYSSLHPQEEVSLMMSESAILKRMVPSVILSLAGNKVLVELKRKLEEIYNS